MPLTTLPVKKVFLKNLNQFVTFTDREEMKVGHPVEHMHMSPTPPPAPKLPIDWAKKFSFPIEGNDVYGDCMMAAAEHGDNTFTGNVGTESAFNPDATVRAYLRLSPHDTGLNTGQILDAWRSGLPGIASAKIMDSLGIDTKDALLVQNAIFLFGGVFFQLAIPEAWYTSYVAGNTWDAPATPDSKNGHAIWWNGVNTAGHYQMQTWGTAGWITPAGVADCDPSGFVGFSARWFNREGKAPNGFTFAELAQRWKEMGGKSLPAWPMKSTLKDHLLPGQGLLPGELIRSEDSRFSLIMQGDGNLVIYGPGGQPLWATGTHGHTSVFDVIMQGDGNLVIYEGDGHPIWSSKTDGKPGSKLIMQNDGNLVIYDAANHAVWASNTVVPAEPAKPTIGDRLLPGQGLIPNQEIKSADQRFRLILQTDGNLVLYGPHNQPMWASNTHGHGNVWSAIMQGDGNFVIYDAHNHAIWASNTDAKGANSLVLQNDGNLVLYQPNNHSVWASNTVVPLTPVAPTHGDRLLIGQGLQPGGQIKSADGRFSLILQGDGNLVIYGPGHQALWASHSDNHSNVWDVVMQGDGNLVVYDVHNHPLWASNTNGKGATSLVMQNDGNLVLYEANNHPVWASNTVVPGEPAKPTVADRLLPNQGLIPGGTIKSTSGRFRATLQSDGNFVLYDSYNVPIWASKTNNHGDVWDLVMQGDGNLVMYDAHNHPFWATNTNGKAVSALVMQDDGNLVLYDNQNHALWASNTANKP